MPAAFAARSACSGLAPPALAACAAFNSAEVGVLLSNEVLPSIPVAGFAGAAGLVGAVLADAAVAAGLVRGCGAAGVLVAAGAAGVVDVAPPLGTYLIFLVSPVPVVNLS